MKARVRATGEIVDVKFSTHPNPAVDETYWWCKDKEESYHKSELDFMGSTIDWEQRRYEIAKAYYIGNMNNNYTSMQDDAKAAVQFADTLIAELKKGNE